MQKSSLILANLLKNIAKLPNDDNINGARLLYNQNKLKSLSLILVWNEFLTIVCNICYNWLEGIEYFCLFGVEEHKMVVCTL